MKLQKIPALVLAGTMLFSITACGVSLSASKAQPTVSSSSESTSDSSENTKDSSENAKGSSENTATEAASQSGANGNSQSAPADTSQISSEGASSSSQQANTQANEDANSQSSNGAAAQSTEETDSRSDAAGTDYANMTEEEISAQFYVKEIDDALFARIQGKSYKDDCTVPVEDLRYIHLLHKDLDGNILEGEMICNVYIADDVCEIFKELYDADYPIEKVRLVDEYDADDESSMEDNNSSCFNFRFISHTTTVSKHGLGLAVDINTLYNPYIKTVDGELIMEPANAGEYTDRSKDFPYKIDENDLAYKLFTEHGFEWGGSWDDRKDYQHFEMPDDVVAQLYPQ